MIAITLVLFAIVGIAAYMGYTNLTKALDSSSANPPNPASTPKQFTTTYADMSHLKVLNRFAEYANTNSKLYIHGCDTFVEVLKVTPKIEVRNKKNTNGVILNASVGDLFSKVFPDIEIEIETTMKTTYEPMIGAFRHKELLGYKNDDRPAYLHCYFEVETLYGITHEQVPISSLYTTERMMEKKEEIMAKKVKDLTEAYDKKVSEIVKINPDLALDNAEEEFNKQLKELYKNQI